MSSPSIRPDRELLKVPFATFVVFLRGLCGQKLLTAESAKRIAKSAKNFSVPSPYGWLSS